MAAWSDLRREAFAKRHILICIVVFIFYSLSNWLLTNKIFPLTAAVAPLSRDIATLAEALALLTVAFIAIRRPRLMREELFSFGTLILLVVGNLILTFGLQDSPLLATIGVSIVAFAYAAIFIVMGCTFMQLGAKTAGACILIALTISYVLKLFLEPINGIAIFLLFALLPIGSVLLAYRSAGEIIRFSREGSAPAELAITNPLSFLPFNHQLFVCLLLFKISFGYALSFGEIDNTPLTTFAGIIPLSVFCIFLAIKKRMVKSDVLFSVAVLLVIAGYEFVALGGSSGRMIVNNLLDAGSSCFNLMFWVVLVTLALRNKAGAVSLFAWGNFIACIGVVSGAFLGRMSDQLISSNQTAAMVVNNLIVLCFIGYTLIALKKFSFGSTIDELEESPRVKIVPESIPRLDVVVEEIAREYGLTPRETEIFFLLARGRNGVYIQEELVVSYNTVKTHVGHIYTKLEIRTHQDLINFVESRCR
jgi:DNA-binding CsgD family transcriptional regulator